jgi:hypothetical protein
MHTQVRGGAPPFTRYADLRCGLVAVLLAASFGFLPVIGSSISFCPVALFGFLVGFDPVPGRGARAMRPSASG